MAGASKITKTETDTQIHSLNVGELKEAQKPKKEIISSNKWYDKVWYWILIGSVLMLPIFAVGIFQNKFLIITPLGPMLGLISFYIRRLIKSHNLDVTQDN